MAQSARVVPLVEIPDGEAVDAWTEFREGAQEVLVTLLATLAFGLTWAAIEAGRANSALVRIGIPAPTASAEPLDPAPLGETRYARVLIDER